MLYLAYYLRYHNAYFLFEGKYDSSKKNLRNTPPPFPNGWFLAANAKDLSPGQVKPIDINGQNIVLFRGKDKIAYALEAYCLHMGANLGVGGQIVN